MYGWEIYRAHTYGCIESCHLKFIKHILDVKVRTNSTMLYAENGRYSFSVHINIYIYIVLSFFCTMYIPYFLFFFVYDMYIVVDSLS